MNDPPQLPSSAFGVETARWTPLGTDTLLVRVSGRWHRPQPAAGSEPVLVLERGGRRFRFPARPQESTPGGTGTATTWQMTFAVPAELAAAEGLRAWLQIGPLGVPVPVPTPREDPATDPAAPASTPAPEAAPTGVRDDPPPSDLGLLAERRLRTSELALEAARARAVEAEERANHLSSELDWLARELERAHEEVRERDRGRRRAEQQAFAETARRQELQEELDRLTDQEPEDQLQPDELRAAQAQVQELEEELERLRRRLDEADQAVAAAEVARSRAELEQQRLRQELHTATAAGLGREEVMAAEVALAARGGPVPPAGEPLSPQRLGPPLLRGRAQERRLLGSRRRAESRRGQEVPPQPGGASARQLPALLEAIRAELGDVRELSQQERHARAQAELRAAELERRLAESQRRSQAAYEAIVGLRQELSLLARAAGARARPLEGAQPVAELLPPAAPSPGAAPAPAAVDPLRLDRALTRLREAEPPEPEAEADEQASQRRERPQPTERHPAATTTPVPARAWLRDAFRLLCAEDPMTAGRLVVGLLPAQAEVHPGPLSYDLVLSDADCLHLTLPGDGGPATLTRDRIRRRPQEVQFAVIGSLPALARLLNAGAVRRRLGVGTARIQGRHDTAGALLDLIRRPVALGRLLAAGVVLDPWVSASLAARMIDPEWTRGHSFSLCFGAEGGAATLLHVADGRPLSVSPVSGTSGLPQGTVLSVPSGGLEGLLAQDEAAEQLVLTRAWIERAQSG